MIITSSLSDPDRRLRAVRLWESSHEFFAEHAHRALSAVKAGHGVPGRGPPPVRPAATPAGAGIPSGPAYVVRTGIATLGTVRAGITHFHDPAAAFALYIADPRGASG